MLRKKKGVLERRMGHSLIAETSGTVPFSGRPSSARKTPLPE
jgi:hypothetical protein